MCRQKWDIWGTDAKKMLLYVGSFIVLGLASFLYPMRFIEKTQRWGGLEGLLAAGVFLGILAFLIYKAGKSFAQMDAIERKRLGQSEP